VSYSFIVYAASCTGDLPKLTIPLPTVVHVVGNRPRTFLLSFASCRSSPSIILPRLNTAHRQRPLSFSTHRRSNTFDSRKSIHTYRRFTRVRCLVVTFPPPATASHFHLLLDHSPGFFYQGELEVPRRHLQTNLAPKSEVQIGNIQPGRRK
jgi:hypothetical protein